MKQHRKLKMYGINHQRTIFAGLNDWYVTTNGNMKETAHWLMGAYGLTSEEAGEVLLDYQNYRQEHADRK